MDRVEEFIMSGSRIHMYSMNTEHMVTPKQLYINLEPKDGLLEIPDFFIRHLRNVIGGYSSAIYNLAAVGGTTTRKMIKGALSDFMKAAPFRRLSSVHMTSGGSYYGLPGVIMDEDFHILMMTTFNIKIHSIDTFSFSVIGHNCRVSPRVFGSSDRNIEKMIIKKVIPFCASHVITAADIPTFNPTVLTTKVGTTMKVIIEDIDQYFIHTAVPPKISEDTNKIVNDILKTNISSILV